MGSAAEVEVAALDENVIEVLPIRQCLIDMGHPQPGTVMNTDKTKPPLEFSMEPLNRNAQR